MQLFETTDTRRSATIILIIVGVLAGIGALMVLATTQVKAMDQDRVLPIMFLKQCLWILVAGVACLATARMDHRRLIAASPKIMVAVWIGLIMVLLFGTYRNGARRWISVGFFSLQVSEFAKLGVILACAHYAAIRRDVIGDYRRGFLPAAAFLGLTVGLVAKEPDFGTSMFLLGTGFILLWLGGMRLIHIGITGALTVPVFVAVMMDRYKHVVERLNTLSDGPHAQVKAALKVMGSGGVFGEGIGEGRAQLWFVPFVESDFIFAAVGEQMGLVGTLGVIGLFLAFFWHGLAITMRAKDQSAAIVAFGVTFMVVFQAAINMAVVTGLVPPKGIGLPFVSYGGSSMVMLGGAVGVLVSIARSIPSATTATTPIAADEEFTAPSRSDAA